MKISNNCFIDNDEIIGYKEGTDGAVTYIIIFTTYHRINCRTDTEGLVRVSYKDIDLIRAQFRCLFDMEGNKRE